MPIEVDSGTIVCSKCGTSYGRRKGNFPASYAVLYKGLGYIPVCKNCIDNMYNKYLAECGNAKDAVRQMCRKLDLYWSEAAFDTVGKKNTTRSMMTGYLQRLTTINLIGKCYDDTLAECGSLWKFPVKKGYVPSTESVKTDDDEEEIEVPAGVADFWGPGYTPAMYMELENRMQYWKSKLPDSINIDIGTEALLRQICCLEIDINKDRAQGKPVDKNVNTLNTLLGSAMLKPTQKKDDADTAFENQPFGVGIKYYENRRPIPEPDPELKDVDGIVRYIDIFFRGHLAKMLGLKSAYSKLYEDEMAKIRVERPEYDEEDDEALFNDVFGGSIDSD